MKIKKKNRKFILMEIKNIFIYNKVELKFLFPMNCFINDNLYLIFLLKLTIFNVTLLYSIHSKDLSCDK